MDLAILLGEDVEVIGIAGSRAAVDGATEAGADARCYDRPGCGTLARPAHPVDDVVAVEASDRVAAVSAEQRVRTIGCHRASLQLLPSFAIQAKPSGRHAPNRLGLADGKAYRTQLMGRVGPAPDA